MKKRSTDHDHSKKDITTQEFNELTSENFASRLAQVNLPGKNDIANFVKETEFDDKLKNLNKNITSIKAKHLLVENEKKIENLTQVFLLFKVTLIMMEHNFT